MSGRLPIAPKLTHGAAQIRNRLLLRRALDGQHQILTPRHRQERAQHLAGGSRQRNQVPPARTMRDWTKRRASR
ncbi:MAG: hypothetical protein ACJAVS_000369 [Paracoccaceae bacterium]|jgi:hypothetical protein